MHHTSYAAATAGVHIIRLPTYIKGDMMHTLLMQVDGLLADQQRLTQAEWTGSDLTSKACRKLSLLVVSNCIQAAMKVQAAATQFGIALCTCMHAGSLQAVIFQKGVPA